MLGWDRLSCYALGTCVFVYSLGSGRETGDPGSNHTNDPEKNRPDFSSFLLHMHSVYITRDTHETTTATEYRPGRLSVDCKGGLPIRGVEYKGGSPVLTRRRRRRSIGRAG
eukprot:1195186-Prorocentrum_minimum.AAC.4